MSEQDPPGDGSPRTPGTVEDSDTLPTAATRLLRSLRARGISYVFANLGTDHAPILEAVARHQAQDQTDEIPELIVCPHEFAAMSAAHGYALATGEPQAVLVHVDVGTQNLGAAMHNAHRGRVPVVVLAGLAPVTDRGYRGSRDTIVHYFQDVSNQSGIVEDYCRWTHEYRPPGDPDDVVSRAIDRARAVPQGPTYLSATREALETPVRSGGRNQPLAPISRPAAADGTVRRLVDEIEHADAPLVITSGLDTAPEADALETLVSFAETAGAGVVEHGPTRLCFPRDHPLHVGFSPGQVLDPADLIIAADVDVPWVPADGTPPAGAHVVLLDQSPTKPTYPRYPFRFDERIAADPSATLRSVTAALDTQVADLGQVAWADVHRARVTASRETVADHRSDERLTPAVASATLADLVDDRTIVVDDATTNTRTLRDHLPRTRSGTYYWSGGSGLGWGAPAAAGVKLAHPDRRVLTVVGDGAYVFSNPTACAWFGTAHDLATLTVVYNNSGWDAVSRSTLSQHPDGTAARDGVPGSSFEPRFELAQPAQSVGAHAETVRTLSGLRPALERAIAAVDGGTQAVVDVHVEPV